MTGVTGTGATRALTSPRSAAVAGVLFALLFSASILLINSSLPEQGMPTEFDDATSIRLSIGLALVPFAGVAFLWFTGVVRDRFKDTEDQLFSSVFIGSGLLFLAMMFVSAAVAGSIVATMTTVGDEAARAEVANFSRAMMVQISNIYALRMAGVLLLALGTMWLRTRVMPRWLALVTYAVAIVLLFVTSLSMWVTFVFPAWVLAVSILILVLNYRRQSS
jgi:hypothetical protein